MYRNFKFNFILSVSGIVMIFKTKIYILVIQVEDLETNYPILLNRLKMKVKHKLIWHIYLTLHVHQKERFEIISKKQLFTFTHRNALEYL